MVSSREEKTIQVDVEEEGSQREGGKEGGREGGREGGNEGTRWANRGKRSGTFQRSLLLSPD